MTRLPPLWILLAVLLVLGAGCKRHSAPPRRHHRNTLAAPSASGTDTPPMRLYVTRPTPQTLRNLTLALDPARTGVTGLEVVGLYHVSEVGEKREYEKTARLIAKQKTPWLRLERLDCPIGFDDLWHENGCSPVFREIAEHADGIVIPGGFDIDPALYGEPRDRATKVRNRPRQYWETSLLFHLLGGPRNPEWTPLLDQRPNLPILGICLGMQEMNVAAGGTLVQDIPGEIYGRRTWKKINKLPPDQLHRNPLAFLLPKARLWKGSFHALELLDQDTPEGFWRQLGVAETRIGVVMSNHHQAVDALGDGLRVVAVSTDGRVPEAVVHERYPHVLGVQFHPEYAILWDPREEAHSRPQETERNPFYRVLHEDSASLAFHEALWRTFASWVWSTARARPDAPLPPVDDPSRLGEGPLPMVDADEDGGTVGDDDALPGGVEGPVVGDGVPAR